MAHYFAPDRRTDGYDVDGKLAPDSVWRMRILKGTTRSIGLWGGLDLKVVSNNPAVVPNDQFGETTTRGDRLRFLNLTGKQNGTALIEARLNAALWCVLQVNVTDVDFTTNAVKDTRDLSALWQPTESVMPMSGSIPVVLKGVAVASLVRIPVPGSQGLAVELSPRGWKPSGGTTSTIFIQDITGKRHLRLDYGVNNKTNTVDYHWNRSQKPPVRGIDGQPNPHPFNERARFDHTNPGEVGEVLFESAKYLKWGGRVLLVVGVTLDAISIVQSSRPLRRATEVVAGWAGAWAGCKIVGAGGAYVGTAINPGLGTAAGGFVGCIIGGAAGYYAASGAAGTVYDWAADTLFTPLPETVAP